MQAEALGEDPELGVPGFLDPISDLEPRSSLPHSEALEEGYKPDLLESEALKEGNHPDVLDLYGLVTLFLVLDETVACNNRPLVE